MANDTPLAEIAAALGRSEKGIATAVSNTYKSLRLPRALGSKRRKALIAQALDMIQSGSVPAADTPPQEPAPEHEQAAHSASADAVSMSTPLHAPHEILGIRIIASGEGDFEPACKQLSAEGYHPEVINEYQSMSHPHRCVTRVVFVKRRAR